MFETILFARQNHKYFDPEIPSHKYNIRPQSFMKIVCHNKSFFEKHTLFNGIKLTNKLPQKIKFEQNLSKFKTLLKHYLLEKSYYKIEEYLDSYKNEDLEN